MIDKRTEQFSKYELAKNKAREKAIEWQIACGKRDFYMSEYAQMTSYFEKLGKRYGLLKEFKENGIC